MKLYYPRFNPDGAKPANFDRDVEAFESKLDHIRATATASSVEQGDFYDVVTYVTPDGQWKLTISNEYMLYYSLEEV